MFLSKYPETQYEKISSRFGLEGVEPQYILENIAKDFPDNSILVLAINTTYPSDIIASGRHLNRRILKKIDEVLCDLNLKITNLGNYPTKEEDNHTQILPLMKCEWLCDSDWYLLIDCDGKKKGELKFWDINGYYGAFYEEDAAIFIVLPKKQNIQFQELLKAKCEKNNIQFSSLSEVNMQFSKSDNSIIKRIFQYIKIS